MLRSNPSLAVLFAPLLLCKDLFGDNATIKTALSALTDSKAIISKIADKPDFRNQLERLLLLSEFSKNPLFINKLNENWEFIKELPKFNYLYPIFPRLGKVVLKALSQKNDEIKQSQLENIERLNKIKTINKELELFDCKDKETSRKLAEIKKEIESLRQLIDKKGNQLKELNALMYSIFIEDIFNYSPWLPKSLIDQWQTENESKANIIYQELCDSHFIQTLRAKINNAEALVLPHFKPEGEKKAAGHLANSFILVWKELIKRIAQKKTASATKEFFITFHEIIHLLQHDELDKAGLMILAGIIINGQSSNIPPRIRANLLGKLLWKNYESQIHATESGLTYELSSQLAKTPSFKKELLKSYIEFQEYLKLCPTEQKLFDEILKTHFSLNNPVEDGIDLQPFPTRLIGN